MKVFVSMPFNSLFEDTYRVIESAAEENKLKAYRVDQEPYAGSIPDAIENGIKESVIFIADVTGNNPNVLNEVGQAKALGKQIMLISRESPENVPFNIRSLQIKSYSPEKLEDLAAMLRDAFNSPNLALRSMLVPQSLANSTERKFVIGVSPLSYRRATGRSGGYKKFRNTASDYVGLRGMLQSFGLLYGFQTLPEIIDPEDCMDDVLNEKMTLYCIASPKTNRWTGQLLKKFNEKWIPQIDFKADPISEDLKNVKLSLYKDNALLCPDGWKVNSGLDRYQNDFGIIIRGKNPFHDDEMMAIIAGRSSLGTEAASIAFTAPEKIAEISRRLSGHGVNLEDHKQAFWVLVSMRRAIDDREEAITSSLQIEQVGVFRRA